jgi:hypothetical protein
MTKIAEAVAAILIFMGLSPKLASQLWMSLLVASGFGGLFLVRKKWGSA